MPQNVSMNLSLKSTPKPQVQHNSINTRMNMNNLYANLGAINRSRGGCSSCGR